MIAAVVREYDDEGVVEDCEEGWKRFCIEVLVRTHYHLVELCRRHRMLGRFGMEPADRKGWEDLRRMAATYRWVFQGSGGAFTFEQTCEDVGLCPTLVRQRLLSQANPRRDINLLVDWVFSQPEKSRRPEQEPPRICDSVRKVRAAGGCRSVRRGAQTHAVCRYSGRRET